MNKYRELFEKYVAEVGRAPHALTRVWVLGFCDWLARNESGLTQRAADFADCHACGIAYPNTATRCTKCGGKLQSR